MVKRCGTKASFWHDCSYDSYKNDYRYLEFFNQLGSRCIVGGDLNAKNIYWESRINTIKGRELLRVQM